MVLFRLALLGFVGWLFYKFVTTDQLLYWWFAFVIIGFQGTWWILRRKFNDSANHDS